MYKWLSCWKGVGKTLCKVSRFYLAHGTGEGRRLHCIRIKVKDTVGLQLHSTDHFNNICRINEGLIKESNWGKLLVQHVNLTSLKKKITMCREIWM